MTVDVLTLTLIVGTFVPLLVALVTKANASSGVKAFVNVILTAVAGAGTALLANDGSLPWQEVVIAGFASYVAAGAAYSHLWRPAGVAPAIAASTSEVGIGKAA